MALEKEPTVYLRAVLHVQIFEPVLHGHGGLVRGQDAAPGPRQARNRRAELGLGVLAQVTRHLGSWGLGERLMRERKRNALFRFYFKV